jgi:PPOX class probable F420-dependent enzyme
MATSLTPAMLDFVRERHLATLTTLRADGSPHVVPVGFSYDETAHVVRVITFFPSQKAINAQRGCRAAVSQVDGGRWITLEGVARLVTIESDPDEVRRAVEGYAARYREPKERENRVAIVIAVDNVMGRVAD